MRVESPLRIRALGELINGFLVGLSDLGFPPVRSVLYGSYAKGNPQPESDVDLAVWVKKVPSFSEREQPSFLQLCSRYYPISPRFFEAGATEVEEPFIAEILRTGKNILLPQHA